MTADRIWGLLRTCFRKIWAKKRATGNLAYPAYLLKNSGPVGKKLSVAVHKTPLLLPGRSAEGNAMGAYPP